MTSTLKQKKIFQDKWKMRVFGRENVERYAENLKENDRNQNRENNLHFAF